MKAVNFLKQKASILACLLCIITSPSCIGPFTLQDIARLKLKFGDSSQHFVIRNNQILIPADINGEMDTLFFDTGLSAIVVKFSDSAKAAGLKTYKKETSSAFGRTTLRYNKYTPDIHNNIWDVDNSLGVEVYLNKPECIAYPFKLIGYHAISLNSKAPYFLLNFERNELSFREQGQDITVGYKEIKSSFTKTGLYIYLNIGDTTIPFRFDTGFGATLLVNNKPDNIDSEILGEYLGTIFASPLKSVSSDIESTIFYDNVSVGLDSNKTMKYKESVIFISNSEGNVVGLQFLKRFNWIIDFSNKKVWAKPIKARKETLDFVDNDYLFSEINNKLVIVAKKKDEKLTLPLFRQIVKVNNERVTDDNICYYMKYLNNPKNLSTSKLIFKE